MFHYPLTIPSPSRECCNFQGSSNHSTTWTSAGEAVSLVNRSCIMLSSSNLAIRIYGEVGPSSQRATVKTTSPNCPSFFPRHECGVVESSTQWIRYAVLSIGFSGPAVQPQGRPESAPSVLSRKCLKSTLPVFVAAFHDLWLSETCPTHVVVKITAPRLSSRSSFLPRPQPSSLAHPVGSSSRVDSAIIMVHTHQNS